jgi:hypothetical protein
MCSMIVSISECDCFTTYFHNTPCHALVQPDVSVSSVAIMQLMSMNMSSKGKYLQRVTELPLSPAQSLPVVIHTRPCRIACTSKLDHPPCYQARLPRMPGFLSCICLFNDNRNSSMPRVAIHTSKAPLPPTVEVVLSSELWELVLGQIQHQGEKSNNAGLLHAAASSSSIKAGNALATTNGWHGQQYQRLPVAISRVYTLPRRRSKGQNVIESLVCWACVDTDKSDQKAVGLWHAIICSAVICTVLI